MISNDFRSVYKISARCEPLGLCSDRGLMGVVVVLERTTRSPAGSLGSLTSSVAEVTYHILAIWEV